MTGVAALDRREVVAAILEHRNDAVVISGLGAATFDVAAAGDNDRNFYLWGAMGAAALMGLGVALARPETPVIVLTGDGDMLMGLGGFATIGPQRPGNLSIIVLDNGRYGETGMQETHTARGVDLAAVAKACGIMDARVVRSEQDVRDIARRAGAIGAEPLVAIVKIEPAEYDKVIAIRDGAYLKGRLRRAMGLSVE